MSDPDQHKSASRQEIPFRISLRGIFEAYSRLTYEQPVKLYTNITTALDKATRHMMVGRAAAVTMPAGIILRNGARVAQAAVNNGGYGIGGGAAGLAGALGSWWLLGNEAYSALTTSTLLTGTAGSIGATIAAAVVTSPILVPAFTAGRLAGATLLGAAAGAISTLGAAINLKVAFLRSADAFRGVTYDEETLNLMRKPYENGALTKIAEQRRLQNAWNNVCHLTPASRRQVYDSLHREFGDAPAQQPPASAPALGMHA